MSKCYLIFEDGYLICTINHHDYNNCVLTKKDIELATPKDNQ